MATTNDLKNGMTLDIEGQLWSVVEFQHVKPGKGPAFVRTKLKNVLSGKVVEKTFNAGVKVDVAILEKRDMQFLYKDQAGFVFMDSSTYDQMTISAETVGDAANYMLENTEAIVAVHEGNPLYVELPANVPLKITYTEPGLQGDRSSAGSKPATLETGITIQVRLSASSLNPPRLPILCASSHVHLMHQRTSFAMLHHLSSQPTAQLVLNFLREEKKLLSCQPELMPLIMFSLKRCMCPR